jgi:hypothetical protein
MSGNATSESHPTDDLQRFVDAAPWGISLHLFSVTLHV